MLLFANRCHKADSNVQSSLSEVLWPRDRHSRSSACHCRLVWHHLIWYCHFWHQLVWRHSLHKYCWWVLTYSTHYIWHGRWKCQEYFWKYNLWYVWLRSLLDMKFHPATAIPKFQPFIILLQTIYHLGWCHQACDKAIYPVSQAIKIAKTKREKLVASHQFIFRLVLQRFAMYDIYYHWQLLFFHFLAHGTSVFIPRR